LPLIQIAASLSAFGALFFASALQAEDLNIYFKTSPRLELLRPFADPVGMSLLITGADGRPIGEGVVEIRLDAPKPGRFFSTDFPHVEGTRLKEMRLALRQGRANWNYLLPIRGEYHLAVDVAASDGRKARKVFAFKVRENESKWLFLGAFSLGLFFLGFFAGRMFTRAEAAEVAGIVAALLFGAAGSLLAQGSAEPPGKATLAIGSARVGTPSDVRWRLENGPAVKKAPALLTLTITHLEKGKVVFGVEKLAVRDEFSMKFQFPDGAEYKVEAVAHIPGEPVIRNQQRVWAAAAEPPPRAMLPALAYFLALIALGLAAGRWSKLRRKGSSIAEITQSGQKERGR
jgi:hypothetical protein